MNKDSFMMEKKLKDTKILADLLEKFLARKKIEEYKHLDFQFLLSRNLSTQVSQDVENLNLKDIKELLLDESKFYNIVFINAKFEENLSNFPKSIKIKKIKNDQNNLEKKASLKNLNTFFKKEVLEFHFFETLTKPIAFIHINRAKNESCNNHSIYLNQKIHLKENAHIEIIDKFVNFKKNELFNNNVFEIHLNANSKLDHFIFQESKNNFQFNHYKIKVAKNSCYNSFFLNQKSKISRLDFEIDLNATNASAEVKGIYFAKDNQILDHYIKTSHNNDITFSNHFVKGMLEGRSKGIFYASSIAKKDVSKIVAKQLNKNILLSENASSFSKPELWIKTDDVKCFHGSTVGRLDEDALFYLQSRGFDKLQAKKILLKAFIDEIISLIKNEEIKKLFVRDFL